MIRRYFGGVSDVNGDGIVNVLIRPDLPGATLAYVWSADMTLSRNSCPASNEMELIHFDAESIDDIGGNDFWALGTIVHEMKHVSSLYKGYRRRTASRFHPFWIEEGTADIAKEVSSRLAWQRAGGPAMRDRVTGEDLRDAFRSSGGNARAEAYGTFTAMARTVFAISPDSSAVTFHYGDGEIGDVYGSGWHFHRFLRDWVVGTGSSAADERFMRVLNDSLTTAGIAGIEAVTGRPIEQLLIDHAIAMTFAGSESSAGADVPHFTTYDFPTATEVFSQPDPPGFYPWPVTTTGEDTGDDFAPVAVPLATSGTRNLRRPAGRERGPHPRLPRARRRKRGRILLRHSEFGPGDRGPDPRTGSVAARGRPPPGIRAALASESPPRVLTWLASVIRLAKGGTDA